jgi:hypothetical protein
MRMQVIGRGISAVATGLLLWLFTSWVGLRPRPLLVVAVTVGVFALAWLMADVSSRLGAVEWSVPRRRVIPRNGLDARFSRLARILRDRDPSVAAQQVHATLVRVVDDRLAAHHGIDRRLQPTQARSVMGEPLTAYIDEPPMVRRDQTAYLADVITRIEAL